jgi:transcription antitermination factor NusG
MSEIVKKWYVLYTKPRWEKKIDSVLQRKGVESWCPLQKVERQWSDRKKVIEDPLFKSYVFVHIEDEEKFKVLNTDGVLNFVYYLGKPAVVRNEEIDLIRDYLGEEGAKITVESKEAFEADTKIVVKKGVFMDMQGTVLKATKKKVFVSLESIGQVMTIEFPVDHVKAVKK